MPSRSTSHRAGHRAGTGAALTRTVTVTDIAGNTATVTSPPVKIDKTPPVVTASRVDPAELTSLQVDVAVRTALQDGSSLYTLDETADTLGLSKKTVQRDWIFARAWLQKEIERLKT